MNAKIWGRWLTRLFKQVPTRKRRRVQPRLRLNMESLEDRLVPTTYTWVGGAVNTNWSTAANWQNDVAPSTAAGAVNDLVFGTQGVAAATVDNISALSIDSITFSEAGYSISLLKGDTPATLIGGITDDPSIAGTDTVAMALTLKPASPGLQQTFSATAASTLDISGALTGSETTQTINVSGAGTVELDGSNTAYTGAINTTANSGVSLLITNNNALGANNTGTTTVNVGTQLEIDNTSIVLPPTPLTIAEKLILNGSGSSNNGALINVQGNNTWSGPISMNSSSMIGAASGTTLTISGQIGDTGASSVTINNTSGYELGAVGPIGKVSAMLGAGTVVFAHAGGDTYHGQTIIDNGILEIEDPLSLGAGATFGSAQSNTVGAETIVNYTQENQVVGPAVIAEGTLEFNFNASLLGTANTSGPNIGADPNGVLTNPNAAWNAKTNPYVGFQVFNDILVLNGPGYNGIGALYNNAGNNAWDGSVFLGNPNTSPLPDDTNVVVPAVGEIPGADIGVSGPNAANPKLPTTYFTISGALASTTPLAPTVGGVSYVANLVVNDEPEETTAATVPETGVLVLNDANTNFYGNTYIVDGAVNIGDSEALGINSINTGINSSPGIVNAPAAPATVIVEGADAAFPFMTGASLQLQVDSGFDGVADYVGGVLTTPEVNGVAVKAQTHFRNLGYDSVNASGPGQELYIPAATTSGSFTLSITTYNTISDAPTTYTSASVNIAQSASAFMTNLTTAVSGLLKNAGYPAAVYNSVTVSEDIAGTGGNIYRILFNNNGANVNVPLVVSSLPAVQVNPVYGLTVNNPLILWGDGLNSTGGLDSISGINTYTGPVTLPGISTNSGIGVASDNAGQTPAAGTYPPELDFGRPGHFLGDSNYLADDYSLTITGNIAGGAGTSLDKFGAGDLILPFANSYVGPNDIEQGWVTIENNQSLGEQQNLTQTLQSYTTVQSGASLMLDAAPGAFLTLANNFLIAGYGIPSVAPDGTVYGLIQQGGAIDNINGDNLITGIVQLESIQTVTFLPSASGTFTLSLNGASTGTLQVSPTAPQTLLGELQTALATVAAATNLTVSVVEQSPGVYGVEFGNLTGQLPLMKSSNANVIVASESAGIGVEQTFPVGTQSTVAITSASEFHTSVTITTSTPLTGLSVGQNVTISGISPTGYDGTFVVTSVNTLLNQFTYTAAAGLGAATLSGATAAALALPTSQLTLEGPLWNDVTDVTGGAGTLGTILLDVGGITKLGSRRLVIQGPGTYTGNVVVADGVLLVQNSTGLGAGNITTPPLPTVTVDSGAALELGNTVTAISVPNSAGGNTFSSSETGGLEEGLEINDEDLILDGTGDPTFGDSPLEVLSSNALTTGPEVQTFAVDVGGTFTLSYGGINYTTPTITEGTTTTAAIQADLDALASITDAPGAYATVSQEGNVYLITITNPTDPGLALTESLVAPAGTGNSTYAVAGYTDNGSTSESLAPVNDPLVSTDNVWNGPIALNDSATVNNTIDSTTTITIPNGSRLIVGGTISNGSAVITAQGYGGAGLTLTGGGELDLDGNNTYGGTTTVAQGVLTAGNNGALGTTGVSDVQTITLSKAVAGTTKYTLTFTTMTGTVIGPFTFTYSGNTAADLAADALAIETKFNNALDGLPAEGDGGASIAAVETSNTLNGTTTVGVTITFGGTLSGFPQNLVGGQVTQSSATISIARPLIPIGATGVTIPETGAGGTIVANGASLQLANSVTIAGEPLIVQGTGSLNAVQTITIGEAATSGMFNLNFTGPDGTGTTTTQSADIDLSVPLSASNLELTLDSFTNIGGYSNAQGVIGSVNAVEEAVQTVSVSIGATGTFKLTYGADTTGALNAASTTLASDIQNALNGLANIGGAGGSVSVVESAAGVYTVTFGGSFATFTTSPTVTALGVINVTTTIGSVTPAQAGNAYIVTFGGGLAATDVQTMTVTPGFPAPNGPITVMTNQVGTSSAENIPTQWFQVGPAGISGGQTEGSGEVAGTVTAVAVDPDDANTIYIATAGGGVWKTINGGQTWTSIFNMIPEIQSINVSTNSTFTLSFTSASGVTDVTGTLSGSDPNLAYDIQNALDGLGNIGGANGLVTVFESGASGNSATYQITFAGSLAGYQQQLIQLNANNGSTAATEIEVGGGSTSAFNYGQSFALYVGSILINPDFPNIVYVGTGDADNSADSYYGTGIYESTNAGVTWSLITNNTAANPSVAQNPFYGKVITSMTIDPESVDAAIGDTGDLVVADGDSTQGNNELQYLSIYGPLTEFTLSLTAPNAQGKLVTDTTLNNNGVACTFPEIVLNGFTTATEIATDLDEFTNVGGVGAYVSVGFVTIPATGPGTFAGESDPANLNNPYYGSIGVEFEGTLAYTTLPALVTNFPNPLETDDPPWIGVTVTSVSNTTDLIGTGLSGVGPTTDVNGSTGTPGSAPGIWVYDANPQDPSFGSWFNITSYTSTPRSSIPSANKDDLIYGPTGTDTAAGGPGYPNTPGPDDNYQLFFPQSNATWSDVAIVPEADGSDPPTEVMFAALGSVGIGQAATFDTNPNDLNYGDVTGVAADGVFFSTSFPNFAPTVDVGGPAPDQANAGPSFFNPGPAQPQLTTWMSGNIWTGTVPAGNAVYTPDNEIKTSFINVLDATAPSFEGPGTPEFPYDVGPFGAPAVPGNPGAGDDGYLNTQNGVLGAEIGSIKLQVFTGGTYSLEPNEGLPPEVLPPPNGFNFAPYGSGDDGFATVFAEVTSAGGALLGIFESTDGGLDWATVASLPTQLSGEGQYDNAFLVDPKDTQIQYVGGQATGGNFATQAGEIFMSTNGGASWTDITIGSNGEGPHDSIHSITYVPSTYTVNAFGVLINPGDILVGTDGGLWLFTPNAGVPTGGTWTDLNGNLPTAEVTSIAADPTTYTGLTSNNNTVTAIASVAYNGTAGYTQGQQWAELDNGTAGEYGGSQVYIDPQDPSIMYEVLTQLGSGQGALVEESQDDGATWSPLLNFPTLASSDVPLVMDQIEPERLVVGSGVAGSGVAYFDNDVFDSTTDTFDLTGALYETGDATAANPSWTNVGATLPYGFSVTQIGLAEYQGTFQTDPAYPALTDQGANAYVPNTMYVTNGANVYVTMDGGQTWVERDGTGTASLPSGAVSDGAPGGGNVNIVQLVVDPRDMYTVYAVVNGFNQGNAADTPGIYVSYNAGQTWALLNNTSLPNVPVWSLAIDPRNSNLYVGTDIGVFEMPGGAVINYTGTPPTAPTIPWQVFGTGMPNVQVHDLVLNPITNTLLAATYGEGVFELFLDASETAITTSDVPYMSSAVTGLSGQNVWTGPVILEGSTPVAVGAYGTENQPNGLPQGSINFVGVISDLTTGANPGLDKVGGGDVILSGDNIYGGPTSVYQGNLIVANYNALGNYSAASDDSATVYTTLLLDGQEYGASLELESNLGPVPLTLYGDGGSLDAHYTGSLRNISGDNIFLGSIDLGSLDPFDTVTIAADSGSELTLNGDISGLAATGGDSLVKEGLGTVIVQGDNSYTGATLVYQGALQTQNSSGLGAYPVTVVDGAQLQVQSPQALTVTHTTPNVSFTISYIGPNALGNLVTDSAAVTYNTTTDTLTQIVNIIEAALNGMSNVGGVGGSVSVMALSANAFAITFEGTLVENDTVPLSSIVSVSKPGFGVTVAIQAVPIAVPNQLTISGNGLTQGIADTGAVLNTGGDNTWSGNISLGIVPGFSPSNPPTGDVAIGAAGGSTLNVTGTVDGLQELGANQTGAIGANNGSTSQEMGLSKVGSGTLFLGNANQFSGGVIVSQGNLVIGNSQGLGTHPTVDPDLATVEQIVVLSPDQMGTVTLGFSGQTAKTGYGPGGTAPTAAGMAQTLNGLFASAGYVGVNVNVEETSIPTSTQDVTTGVTNPIGGELFTVTFSDPGDPLAFSSTPLTANGTEGVVAGASFVTQPSTDVYVATSAELDLTNNVDIVGHTVTLNGSGVNGSNGALESVGGDNTWDGPISIETGPLSNTAASIGASSGTSLTLAGSFVDTPALDNGGLSLGGAPVSPTATGGGGSIIFPQGTSLALPIYLTGGNTQIDSTAGFANDTFYLEGGALSGLGTVGPIVDGSIDGGGIIDSGDNADSALVNGSLFFPNEFNNLNTVGTLTTNTNLTLTFNDTYDAYIGDPTQPNSSTLLSVEGTLTILSDSSAGAVLAGYVDSTYTTTSPPVEIITASGGISGTFVNEAASPPTSDPGAPTQVGLNAITVAFIGNEEFYVDYYNTSIYVHRVAETVTISALTPSVPPGAPLSVSPPPPATSNVIQTATVDYGEDVQAYVDLYTTSSFVNLTGSTAIFQLVTPAGVPYQYISVPVTYVSPGVYMAEIDLPDNLASPLNVTTTANPMTPYVVSVFYDGGFSNGEAIFAADSVSDGTVIGHTATTEAYQQLNVAVSPTPTTTNLTVTPAAANNTYGYGADLTFTATVAGAITLAQQPNPADVSPPVATPAGTVDFYDTPLGGTKTLIAAVPVTNGVATFTDPFLPEGEHSIYAVYVSQSSPEDYIGSTSNTLPTITINQAVTTTTLSVGNTPINYNNTDVLTATVVNDSADAAADPVGSVEFEIGSTVLGTVALVNGAIGTSTATLNTNPYQIAADGGNPQTIVAYYEGNSNFDPSNSETTTPNITVNPINSTTNVTASPSSSSTGQSVTYTATIVPNPLVAGYPYALPTGTVTFTISNGTTSITATENVTPISGVATATFTTTNSPISPVGGNDTVTAVYSGDAQNDGNYYGSSGTTTETVTEAVTTTTLSATPSSVVALQAVTLTATVVTQTGAAASGTVDFYDYGNDTTTATLLGSATLNGSGNGAITLILPNDGTAPYTQDIVADYLGTSVFNPSTSSAGSTVTSPATDGATPTPVTIINNGTDTSTVALSSSLDPSQPGQSVTLTATVTATGSGASQTLTGTVIFTNTTTGATLGFVNLPGTGNTATVTLNTSAFVDGTNNITATYSGSNLFAVKTSNILDQDVQYLASSVTLASSVNPSGYGQSVTLTATIKPTLSGPTPGGSVTFYANGTALTTVNVSTTSGVTTAKYTTTTLPEGTYPIYAEYNGDPNYLPEQSNTVSQTVTADKTTTTLTGTTGSVDYGQSVSFTATVKNTSVAATTPVGTVTFWDANSNTPLATVAVSTTSGITTAKWTTKTLAADPNPGYAIYAVFNSANSTNVANSTSNTLATLIVNPDPVTISAASSTTSANSNTNLTVTVAAASPGSGTPTGTVTIYTSTGIYLGQATLVGGKATINVPNGFTAGNHTFVITYTPTVQPNGYSDYAGETVNKTIDYTVGRST